MKHVSIFAALAVATLIAAPAFASEESCGNAPTSEWMSKDAMKEKAVAAGYEVRQVKVEGSCYEVYGIKDGKKVEIRFNPVTGEQVGGADED